ncbi:TRAP transporter large permease subunit [Dactylosporangium sp. CA-092794]|uniref:TRAP transporter large permease n=1 Tax=Dactylosporangium sp. CA-092794 TaxID=3239929 RepID=UPI003D8F58DA
MPDDTVAGPAVLDQPDQPPPPAGPGAAARAWTAGIGGLVHAAEALIVVAIVGEMAATIAGIISRHFFSQALAWTDDLSTACLCLITFLGGAVAIQRGRGMSLDLLVRRLPEGTAAVVRSTAEWVVVACVVRLLATAPGFLRTAQANRTANLGLPTTVSAIWLPVGLALLLLFTLDRLRRLPPRAVAIGFVIAAAASAGIVWVGKLNWDGVLAVPPLAGMLVLFALTLAAGVPIGFVITAAALTFIELDGTVPLAGVPVAMQSGISGFVLLAIPFFMLAGVLMDVGGLASQLINVILPIVSRLPGGLLITQVFAVYVFSGISGSKTADIAAIGSAMRKPLREAGYPPQESTAVLASAAAMSETVPPSLAIIILASITTVSPGSLFLAGILPALAMAIVLSIGILIRGRGGRYPRAAVGSFRDVLRALPPAIPALILPVILIYGIVAGIGTSTEVSALAALYGMIVVSFGYRSLNLGQLWRACVDASVLGGLVLFIISVATVLSQSLTLQHVPQRIADLLADQGSAPVFMVLSVITLLILGGLLEGLPAIVVFAPLLLPVAVDLGVDPLQYAVVLIIAMGIGSFAPPLGAGLYVAAAIGQTTVEKVMKPAAVYTGVLIVGLAIVAALPQITLVVPHFFGRF